MFVQRLRRISNVSVLIRQPLPTSIREQDSAIDGTIDSWQPSALPGWLKFSSRGADPHYYRRTQERPGVATNGYSWGHPTLSGKPLSRCSHQISSCYGRMTISTCFNCSKAAAGTQRSRALWPYCLSVHFTAPTGGDFHKIQPEVNPPFG